MQLYCDYYQVWHSLAVSCAVVNIFRISKYWFWRELSQKVTRMSQNFPFDILIDILTSNTIYQLNLKNRFSLYITYRYAALLIRHLYIESKSWFWYPQTMEVAWHVQGLCMYSTSIEEIKLLLLWWPPWFAQCHPCVYFHICLAIWLQGSFEAYSFVNKERNVTVTFIVTF